MAHLVCSPLRDVHDVLGALDAARPPRGGRPPCRVRRAMGWMLRGTNLMTQAVRRAPQRHREVRCPPPDTDDVGRGRARPSGAAVGRNHDGPHPRPARRHGPGQRHPDAAQQSLLPRRDRHRCRYGRARKLSRGGQPARHPWRGGRWRQPHGRMRDRQAAGRRGRRINRHGADHPAARRRCAPFFMRPGDVGEVEIERIGIPRSGVAASPAR